MSKCTKCGNGRFYASQRCYHDIVVDANGEWIEDIAISDAEKPYGPYICTECDESFEELPAN